MILGNMNTFLKLLRLLLSLSIVIAFLYYAESEFYRSGFKPRRSLEVILFTSEEPTRFGISCLGRLGPYYGYKLTTISLSIFTSILSAVISINLLTLSFQIKLTL